MVTGTAADAAAIVKFSEDMLPSLSMIARNDSAVGEVVSRQILFEASGKRFVSIQNASGHGADLVYIDDATKTVYHVEVKTSGYGNVGGTPTHDLSDRFDRWISEASGSGRITGQALSPDAIATARQIKKMVAQEGYSVSHGLMQVEVLGRGGSGTVSATLRPWPPAHTGD